MDHLYERFDRFIFDLDGTLWSGEELLPYAVQVLGRLRRDGKVVAFITNSPMRTCHEVAQRLSDFGIVAEEREVVTAGRAVAGYLRSRRLDDCSLYVLGGQGLHDDLRQETDVRIVAEEEGASAEVVVVGYDEEISFIKLRTAFKAIHAGARFIATNRDRVYPVGGELWPASGLVVAGLEYSTGVRAVSVGKPEKPMLDLANQILGEDGPTLLIGDQPDADIGGARRMGWAGALVLTGITDKEGVSDFSPDYVLKDLSDLCTGVDP